MGGGGGFVGSIQNSAQTTVNLGYATVGTDTGHQGAGTDASWAYNNLERQVNFGYLAVHRTAETAKAIIASYYGTPPTRNYFQGCSRGGGQALMEAQRFPADFDGIIAGAPAYDWTGDRRRDDSEHAGALSGSEQDRRADVHAGARSRRSKRGSSRRATRSDGVDGRRHRRSAPVQVRRQHAAAVGGAEERAQGDLRADDQSRTARSIPGSRSAAKDRRRAGRRGSPARSRPAPGQAPSLRFAFGTGIFKYLVFNDPDWDYSKYDLTNWKKDTALAATLPQRDRIRI